MLGAVIEENQIIEISKMFLNTWLHWFSCTLKVFIKSLTITQVLPYTAAKRAIVIDVNSSWMLGFH